MNDRQAYARTAQRTRKVNVKNRFMFGGDRF